MRASRLLFILSTLQAKGRATAGSLAEACEVSVRTIYRDIDALSAAGAPVYAERGPEGGYRLLDGYRTRLNGLSREEAEALFLAGLQGPAALLGLGSVLQAAEMKLLSALPEAMRTGALSLRARFHFDAADWFADLEEPPALREVAAAVWRQQPLLLRYRSRKQAIERRIEPLGLVLKGGTWYLAARVGADVRTFLVSRILELEALEGSFAPPADFQLADYWRKSAEQFELGLYRETVTVRLSPRAMQRLHVLGRVRAKAAAETASEPDEEGWRVASLPAESLQEVISNILRLGPDAEILDPPAARAAVAQRIGQMAQLYG